MSETEFEEISFIGTKVVINKHTAVIYPDKVLIQDLLLDIGGVSELSSQKEYEDILQKQ